MAVLSWGKCGLETTPSVNGAPDAAAQWKAIDTPKKTQHRLPPQREQRRPPRKRAANLLMSVMARTPIRLNLTCLSKKACNARLKTMTD